MIDLSALQSVWTIVAGALTLGGGGIAWLVTNADKRREESAKTIIDNQTTMKNDLKSVCDAHATKIDRLEQRVQDYRTGTSIDADIAHAKNNVLTVVNGVKSDLALVSHDARILQDRVVRLETQHEQTSITVNEIKNTLKDTRHEINDRLDKMADCLSEISKKVG